MSTQERKPTKEEISSEARRIHATFNEVLANDTSLHPKIEFCDLDQNEYSFSSRPDGMVYSKVSPIKSAETLEMMTIIVTEEDLTIQYNKVTHKNGETGYTNTDGALKEAARLAREFLKLIPLNYPHL